MNSITGGYLAETFFHEYQVLRNELMETLGDADLSYRLGGETARLGVICREIGGIEHAYVESFRTFRQDFSYRNSDPELEHSIAALNAWLAELDRELMASVEALSEADMSPPHHPWRLRRGLLLTPSEDAARCLSRGAAHFLRQGRVYLRALGRPLPGHWRDWIG